jgi:hypothetical protein
MIESELTRRLRLLSQAYVAATELSPATVWFRAVGDSRFLERLAAGGSFTVRTYDRILAFFDARWPVAVPWPDSVPRPSSGEAAP